MEKKHKQDELLREFLEKDFGPMYHGMEFKEIIEHKKGCICSSSWFDFDPKKDIKVRYYIHYTNLAPAITFHGEFMCLEPGDQVILFLDAMKNLRDIAGPWKEFDDKFKKTYMEKVEENGR